MAEAVLLRDWRDDDLESFVQMNADPEVMAFFERPLSREESAAMLGRIRQALRDRGWGLWAVDVDGRLAGFTGLAQPTFSSPFTPCVEIGWRLRREFWGRGLAFQAARQAEAYAFKTLGLPELVSFTAVINQRSRRLMERLEAPVRACPRGKQKANLRPWPPGPPSNRPGPGTRRAGCSGSPCASGSAAGSATTPC